MGIFKRDNNAFESRIHEIDFFRGILIILVVFDHLMWFINYYIFKQQSGFLTWYWTSGLRYVVRQIVLMLFLFTCGISCHLSRNNLKRGLILLCITILIPLVTRLLQPLPMFSNRVIIVDFNIIGVIALSILLYACFEKHSNTDIWILVIMLFLVYQVILLAKEFSPSDEYNGFQSIFYVDFNPTKAGLIADYLPLFPYIIFLPLGVIFARKFYKNKSSLLPRKDWEKPICFLGRHTLIIYLAHEVILTPIFMGIGALIK